MRKLKKIGIPKVTTNCTCKARIYCDLDCNCIQLNLNICPPHNNGDACERRGTCVQFIYGTETGRCGCTCGLCKEITEGGEKVWNISHTSGGYKVPSAAKYLL